MSLGKDREWGERLVSLIILYGGKRFMFSLRLFFSENKQLNTKWGELLDSRVEIGGNADSTSLCHVILAEQWSVKSQPKFLHNSSSSWLWMQICFSSCECNIWKKKFQPRLWGYDGFLRHKIIEIWEYKLNDVATLYNKLN